MTIHDIAPLSVMTSALAYQHRPQLIHLSDRFKQERRRLKLSLARVGEICGVSKNTAISWEHGAKIPAEALALFAQVGADVQFIVTGVASANPPIPYDPAAYRVLIDRVIALAAVIMTGSAAS